MWSQGQCTGHARGRAQGAKHGGGVESRLMNFFGRNTAQATHDFRAHRNAPGQISTTQVVKLCGGQHPRNHHCTGVDGATLKGVIVILAMGGGAIDKRSGGDAR